MLNFGNESSKILVQKYTKEFVLFGSLKADRLKLQAVGECDGLATFFAYFVDTFPDEVRSLLDPDVAATSFPVLDAPGGVSAFARPACCYELAYICMYVSRMCTCFRYRPHLCNIRCVRCVSNRFGVVSSGNPGYTCAQSCIASHGVDARRIDVPATA
jgi:hypothetical protein